MNIVFAVSRTVLEFELSRWDAFSESFLVDAGQPNVFMKGIQAMLSGAENAS